METSALNPTGSNSQNTRTSKAFSEMGSDSFLQLLITQLSHQDPFEPMNNEEMLRQISMIREVEMTTSISDAMRNLTGQQKFGSATSMIGRFIRSNPQADGSILEGMVTSIRLDPSGKAVLRLGSGLEVAMEDVAEVESATQAAERLIQKEVVGFDARRPVGQQEVRGVVTAVEPDGGGEVVLKLDNGDLRFRDLVAVLST